MADEISERRQQEAPGDRSTDSGFDTSVSAAVAAIGRSNSSSRLNAGAPEFVPRASSPAAPLVTIHPPTPVSVPAMHVFHVGSPSPPYYVSSPGSFEYYGSGFVENETRKVAGVDSDLSPAAREGLSDEIVHKIAKQVEYYFSDVNLATTEHLMRFISKDPEGFVPISVIASFRKIKALVHNNFQLATALRASSKLVVSEDGKKVRRQDPFTVLDIEELRARIAVAENLPEDHCYQNLMKVFSAVGRVKTIRTCYPQTPNGTTTPSPTNRSAKLDMLFANRLHAFVEYDTVEDAEKAVAELSDEHNWRSGLRLRLLSKCLTKQGYIRGRRGNEADLTGEDDVSTSNQLIEKHTDDSFQSFETSIEHMGEECPIDRDSSSRRGRGRGRGGRGRGRGHHVNNRVCGHTVGTPPSSHVINSEQLIITAANKQPPGPRMPDGTRGFTMGRGRPEMAISTN